MSRFQILHRLDILQQFIVIPVKNALIVFIKFITIAEDDILWSLQLTMYIVVDNIEITVHLGCCSIVKTQQHDTFWYQLVSLLTIIVHFFNVLNVETDIF